MPRKARLRRAAGAVEHVVDVDRLLHRRAGVAERLDALEQLLHAAGLVADQRGEFALRIAQRHLQQLRGARDARQRVLDLMRQHRRHAAHAARRRAVGERAVHLFGDRARLDQQQHRARRLVERRRLHVHRAHPPIRQAQRHVVVGQRHRAAAHPRRHVEHPALRADQIGQRPARQLLGGGQQERLRRRVGGQYRAVAAHQQRRLRQRLPDRLEIHRVHAARAMPSASKPSISAARTASGASSRTTASRIGWPPGTRSSAQDRCFRATRTPGSRP